MPGMEHLPTALAGRRFLSPPRRGSAPVDGIEIHIHAQALEQVGGDIALRLGYLEILRHQTRDGLTGVTALVEQTLGGVQIARAREDIAPLLGVERGERPAEKPRSRGKVGST